MSNPDEVPVLFIHTPDSSGFLSGLQHVLIFFSYAGLFGCVFWLWRLGNEFRNNDAGGENEGETDVELTTRGTQVGGDHDGGPSQAFHTFDSKKGDTLQFGLPTSFRYPPTEPTTTLPSSPPKSFPWPFSQSPSQNGHDIEKLHLPHQDVKGHLRPFFEKSNSTFSIPSHDDYPEQLEYFPVPRRRNETNFSHFGLKDLSNYKINQGKNLQCGQDNQESLIALVETRRSSQNSFFYGRSNEHSKAPWKPIMLDSSQQERFNSL